jgi:hypothetical protein
MLPARSAIGIRYHSSIRHFARLAVIRTYRRKRPVKWPKGPGSFMTCAVKRHERETCEGK